jgi:LysM repeat protein
MSKKILVHYLFVLLMLSLMFSGSSLLFAQQDEQVTHTVQPGENLYRIAVRYGVDINQLAQVNNITDQRRIFSGQTLIIPGLTVPDDSSVVANPLVAGTPIIHVVQPGESLTTIARQYNLTVEQLMQSNNIANPNRIIRGQELNVWTTETVDSSVVEPESAPEAFVEAAAPQADSTYVVQPGEHLSQIAQRYGMSWTTLAQYNSIANPDTLFSGQTLRIPALNENGGVTDMGIISQVISANAPAPTISVGKQIIVDLSDSRIYAYDNGQLLRNVLVSTGLPMTPTVIGDFTVYNRLRSQTMTGPGYYLPNVEYVQYFFQGYAIHGTYWHNNFGYPMSHGCVNLPNDEAAWFYDFADYGTPVHVQA